MPDVKNFTRWKFGSPAAKDRIIIGLMNDNDELKRRLDKLERPDNMPEAVKNLGRRSRNPIFQLSESMEKLEEFKVNQVK